MNYPGLVGIGRLGGRDAEGFHHVMIKPEYRTVFSELEEVYLIFNSDRVFYVTICERKQSDRKTWIKLKEDGVAEEQKLHKEVIIAMAEDSLAETDDSLEGLIGYLVYHEGSLLGKVDDYFFNGAQDVLQILDSAETEYLIPYVDYYIAKVDVAEKIILLQNAADLIDLYLGEK